MSSSENFTQHAKHYGLDNFDWTSHDKNPYCKNQRSD